MFQVAEGKLPADFLVDKYDKIIYLFPVIINPVFTIKSFDAISFNFNRLSSIFSKESR
ncbi:MAG: hypothetical protein GYA35_02630 [Thermoanaerobaculaceae bacterium]|nr:hypothetical protein [Thermoanaerobaculaceae bacterium]